MALTQVDQGLLGQYAQYTGFKNRIINGGMMIDQRNAGASFTPTDGAYGLDRWLMSQSTAGKYTCQINAGGVTPPSNFAYYMGLTSTSAYSVLTADFYGFQQRIEGFNIADFGWGTANAQPATLSFWVRSSLTGTFGGSFRSGNFGISYVFSYTINSANTWEYKTVTITAPTSGTFYTSNGIGASVVFSIGSGSTYTNTAGSWLSGTYLAPTGSVSVVGTSGATWYITGVQLEKGSTATSFDYRPYGTELQLCQRYYYKHQAAGAADYFGIGACYTSTGVIVYTPFKVPMRTAVSSLAQSGTASDYRCLNNVGTSINCSSVPVFNTGGTEGASTAFTVASGFTTGYASAAYSNTGGAAYLAWSAEL